MKKNAKVIEIKVHSGNGKIRTVYAVTPLNVKPTECCMARGIPLPSVYCINVTPPMTYDEAMTYACKRTTLIHLDPRNAESKTSISFC